MNFKRVGTIGATGAVALAVLLLAGSHVWAQGRATNVPGAGKGQAVPVSGTIYGAFDYTFEGKGAWVGYALISIGDAPPRAASFADRNTSFGMTKNGAIYGTETISLRFLDGSGTFDVVARFDGIPNNTPNLYTLHEVGTIANGTGEYAGASGQFVVTGPFLFPDPTSTPGAPPWIAEIHGVISGGQGE
jgi:hypothetical protein